MIADSHHRKTAAPNQAADVPAISVTALKKTYAGTVEAVRGIDFSVAPQARSSASSVRMAQAKPPPSRSLPASWRRPPAPSDIYGEPARDARFHTGYLTQTFSLYPDLTVAENISLHRRSPATCPTPKSNERGNRYLAMFDMDRFTIASPDA